MGGIKRNIGAARFEHRRHRDRHVDTAVEAQRHQCARPDTAASQQMRQPVGALIDLTVAVRLAVDGHRRRFGQLARHALEQRVNAQSTVVFDRGGIAVVGQNAHVARPEQGQIANLGAGIGRDTVEQAHQTIMHALDRGPVEQLGRVLVAGLDAAILRHHVERDVEPCRLGVHPDHARLHAGEARPLKRKVVERDHDLEDRGVTAAAWRVHGLDHQIERHLSIVDGIDRGLADLRQEVGEDRVPS